MNEAQYERLKAIKMYLEMLESDYLLGKVTQKCYKSELKWLDERITALEDEVFPEVKRVRESPEMKAMRESAERFFDYAEDIHAGKR